MSDRFPDDTDDVDDSNGSNRTAESWLSSLLAALDRFDDVSRSGRRDGPTGLDYDVSIRSGLGDLAGDDRGGGPPSGIDRPPAPSRSPPSPSSSSPSGSPNRSRTRRRRATNDYYVTTRRYEDELVITADLSGADPDDVTVGFDDGALVVGVGSRTLERVSVPFTKSAADATVRNGVLTVSVSPDDSSDLDADEDRETNGRAGDGDEDGDAACGTEGDSPS